MLSYQTEKRLAALLVQLLDCESSVEKSRQNLCMLQNFDVFSAFSLIDSETNGTINISDIQNFVSRRGIAITRLHLELLIAQYDSNFDQRLGLDEFQALVLPSENHELRKETIEREAFPPSLYVESVLARHIELEANFQGHLQTFKRSLFTRKDFSMIDAFRAVDTCRENYITVYSLNDFFRKHKISFDFDELEGIIRRIDLDCDMKLNYEEFVAGILPANRTPLDASRKKLRKKPQTRASSRVDLKSSQKSPKRATTALQKPMRNKILESVPPSDIQEILDTLSSQIILDRENEKAKIKLVSHTDFNIPDIFRLLDSKNKSYIECSDIEILLRELQVPFHIDEIYLVLRRFSGNSGLKLNYSDTESLFLPYNTLYNKSTAMRKAREYFDGYRTFSADALDDLISFMKVLLQGENHSECLRKRVATMTWLNLYEIFQMIDRDQDGVLTASDLKYALLESQVKPGIDDFEMIIRRYHKGINCAISYPEFIQELTPKLFN